MLIWWDIELLEIKMVFVTRLPFFMRDILQFSAFFLPFNLDFVNIDGGTYYSNKKKNNLT